MEGGLSRKPPSKPPPDSQIGYLDASETFSIIEPNITSRSRRVSQRIDTTMQRKKTGCQKWKERIHRKLTEKSDRYFMYLSDDTAISLRQNQNKLLISFYDFHFSY